jgi:acyl-coenzyme A synthetase/AMP-(fatty) acid ligase
VYAQIFESILQDLQALPVYPAKFDGSNDASDANETLLPELTATKESDIAFILHTSGSTSNPKLVPCSYRWVDGVVDKLYQFSAPKSRDSQRQVVSAML